MSSMTSSPSNANRSGYDRWAAGYDEAVNSTVAADERAFPPYWACLKDVDVLEIGCGTGRHTVRLAKAGNRVTGLDLSPGMLAQAHVKLAGYENVKLYEADIMADAAPEIGTFDAAITALVIEHIADLPKFFERVAGYLNPGGAFYLSEIHPTRMQNGSGARFIDPDTGEETRLTSFAHAAADVVGAASFAGFALISETDYTADASFCALSAGWEKYLNQPMVRVWYFSADD